MTDLNPRSMGPFERVGDVEVVYASFWEATLVGGETISLLNDQIDPGGYGVTDTRAFEPFVAAKDVYGFSRKEGYAARPYLGIIWTKVYKTKAGAVKAAITRQQNERKKNAGKKLPAGFFKKGR
ncbi:hypothetical protein CcrC1_gp255c [Caulobacter phage C1]|nr:hypothetical protein CcrC1_gp255c [Caulobacter phage C1]UTU08484.1 hypothetical protein CcrC2_gp256c [Caulobacter phage C2]UTU08999.1 hypothetical protein CcrJ4_gp250c [Caulobacter phage J4]UTU09560.1 hypothetical protein CcrBL47_gp274c [Caulobacter phage BL47]UTU10117.1 hypothetical protein CcrRB23_gp255c [Caulobacter phage RB23]WGN97152.1 hypothetical protein [Bertelyvirus sp.]